MVEMLCDTPLFAMVRAIIRAKNVRGGRIVNHPLHHFFIIYDLITVTSQAFARHLNLSLSLSLSLSCYIDCHSSTI